MHLSCDFSLKKCDVYINNMVFHLALTPENQINASVKVQYKNIKSISLLDKLKSIMILIKKTQSFYLHFYSIYVSHSSSEHYLFTSIW